MNEHYVEELLQRCAALPYGPQLNELLERVLELAEQTGDALVEYRVRLLQADACAMSGDSTGLLANFRWCLDRHDQDPKSFPSDPGDGADLLWQYRWLVAVLSADPQIPAEELHGLLEEMQRHYRRAGLGELSVLTARFEVAFANGWMDQAASLYARLRDPDEDDSSYCQACTRSLEISYLFATGHAARGLELLDEMLLHDGGCGQEPAHAIGAALLPMLRAGRGRQTKALHVRSYQAARHDPDNLGLVAHHLIYLVVTGNLERALFLAQRHLPWLAHDPMAQREHLAFLSALALLCGALAERGLGDLELRGSDADALAEFLGEHDQPVRIEQAATLAREAAYELAARFDARNGNDYSTRRVEAVAGLRTGQWHLAWDEDPWLAAHQPVGTPVRAEQYLRRARERMACGQQDPALRDVLHGLQAAPPADVAAGLHQLAMILQLGAGNEQQAAEHLRHYLRQLSRAGYGPLARMLEGYGLDLHRDGTPGQLSALLHAHADGQRDEITGLYVATWLAHARMRHDQFEQAARLCEAAHPQVLDLVATRAGDDVRDSLLHNYYSIRIVLASEHADTAALDPLVLAWRKYNPTDNSLAQVRLFLAQLAAEAGEPDDALEHAERALSVFIAYGDRERAIRAADFSATELLKAGRIDRAKERLRLGLHQAELSESDQKPALRFRLSQLHVDSGEPYEAGDYLSQALAEPGDELGEAERAQLLDLMGDGQGMSERFDDAIDSWEQAAELFEATGNAARYLQTAEKLVNVYLLTGEFAAAQELAEQMVPLGRELADTAGVQPALDALMLLATVQEATGEGDTAEVFSTAATLAARHEQPQLQAQVLVKHAQWASAAGREPQSVRLMLQAAELFEQLGLESDEAQCIGAAAGYLGRAERHEEAVLLFEQALGQPLGGTAAERTLRLRMADSLDALQRPEQAAAQRLLAEPPGQ